MSKCECPDGPTVVTDEHANTTFCSVCGEAIENSAIVADTVFAEASNGRSVAMGVYSAADDTGARSQLGRRGAGMESRQITLANGHRRIDAVATGMRLGPTIKDRAVRFFNLAVSNGFVQGRRTDYVVAACLYIACRLDANSMCMLIDFSDLLKVNVFVLGATFLKLVRSLNMSDKLKPTDPAHLIQRFAALLDFGDETQKVATDAARLVDRFKRDWMVEGRRPAGICGACLLLAARMNNFRRSIDEIVQVVKIADVTVRKRLEEFSKTPNGALTVEDFQNGTTYTEPADPPAFTASQDKERERTGAKESAGTPGSSKGMLVFESPVSASSGKKRKAPPSPAGVAPPEDDDVDPAMTQAIGDEVKEALNTSEAQAVTTELEAHEAAELARQRAQAEEPPDALDDLDEEELDSFILTDAERAVKERLWVLNNKDYLETLAEKHLRGEADEPKKRRKRNKPSAPRDSKTASAASAADATRRLLEKKKISNKLDYNIYDGLFQTSASARASKAGTPAGEDDAEASDEEVEESDEDADE